MWQSFTVIAFNGSHLSEFTALGSASPPLTLASVVWLALANGILANLTHADDCSRLRHQAWLSLVAGTSSSTWWRDPSSPARDNDLANGQHQPLHMSEAILDYQITLDLPDNCSHRMIPGKTSPRRDQQRPVQSGPTCGPSEKWTNKWVIVLSYLVLEWFVKAMDNRSNLY